MTPTAASNRAIKDFVARWEELPCVEEEHSRSFWIEFVEQVLGIPNATRVLESVRQGLAKRRGICNEVVIHHHHMCRWGISRLLVQLAEGARRACEGVLDSGIGKGSRKGSLFLFYIYPMMFCSGMCL